MKTQLLFATGTSRQNLRDVRRFPRPAALRPRRSRLALESLEPRALLTASLAFASCTWMETLPESYWMATCQPAESTSSCPPAAAETTYDEQPKCEETVDTVSVWGGGSTVCIDSNTVCTEQEVNTEEQDCTPTPPCDSTPETECRKSDCEEQPTPQQARQAVFEKIARLLRSVGFDCEYEYDECETPKTDCESAERQSSDKRWGASCNDNSPKNCDERQSEAQERRCNSDKTEICRVVDRCMSDRSWSDSVVRARYR